MEDLVPVSVPDGLCSAPPLPTEPCTVCPRLAAEFEPGRQASYWQAMHERAVQRSRQLQEENAALQARIRALEQRLFGRNTESAATLPDAPTKAPTTPPPPK